MLNEMVKQSLAQVLDINRDIIEPKTTLDGLTDHEFQDIIMDLEINMNVEFTKAMIDTLRTSKTVNDFSSTLYRFLY